VKTKKRDDGCLKSRAKKKDVRDDDDEDGQREQKENHERDDDDDGFVRRQSFERYASLFLLSVTLLSLSALVVLNLADFKNFDTFDFSPPLTFLSYY
jgi:hypothetical protein